MSDTIRIICCMQIKRLRSEVWSDRMTRDVGQNNVGEYLNSSLKISYIYLGSELKRIDLVNWNEFFLTFFINLPFF